MKTANLIFPHQLFESSPMLEQDGSFFLVEEYLFFRQYKFHKQKIAFHRASMKRYESYLKLSQQEVTYVEATEERSDIRLLIADLAAQGFERIRYIDPTDNWLEKRIEGSCDSAQIETQRLDSPLFLNSKIELESFFEPDKSNFNQTSFYIQQRKHREILIDANEKPIGGSWTYDKENRKKYPAKKQPPPVHFPESDPYYEEAFSYVETHFSDHLGELSTYPLYPTGFESSQKWLTQFLEYRFAEFGPYEDAIVAENSILNHSVLSPMLNVGLLTPQEVIIKTLEFADQNSIPLNSTEGFVRQIMGWREFLRGIYEIRGSYQRTLNYWDFKRKIPASFYDGSTGIEPIDQTIKKVLKTGYCHHIERLMILGNFMLLCEFDPDEVYRWFMELFIDAYDWVMVPNVYGMSQFADGGLMASKPYISGSNYLMKMSNYKKGEWQAVWDSLFWRFMDAHRDFFTQNPRLGMLVR
ncbi:MAG: cryptochrome/photolyase family protein, partial [Lutimonas sp.]